MRREAIRRANRAIAAAAVLMLCLPATGRPQASADTEAGRGRAAYVRFGCYECHQYSGAGYEGMPGGARLVPMPLGREAFKTYLRNPAVPRRMPPYTVKLLSDAEADAIYTFLRSLPEPPPLARIPELERIAKEIEGAAAR